MSFYYGDSGQYTLYLPLLWRALITRADSRVLHITFGMNKMNI